MIYYLLEVSNENNRKISAGKARKDCNHILSLEGLHPIKIEVNENDRRNRHFFYKLLMHIRSYKTQKKSIMHSDIAKGDILFVQFPMLSHSIFQTSLFKRIKRRGVKVVLLIHDLSMLRESKASTLFKKARLYLEENSILKMADAIISHNYRMTEKLIELGIDKDRIVDLEIFDYLIEDLNSDRLAQRNNSLSNPVIIAGNLSRHKCSYIYTLPENQRFDLFGVNFEYIDVETVVYRGAFEAEELLYHLDGSFGLVWDGNSSDTCAGAFGEYLKINNPHKTSLYIASGIPVIIWREAALSQFVLDNNCGIVVDSLDQINNVINGISEEEYTSLLKSTNLLSNKMRNGAFLRTAIQAVLRKIEC